VVFWGVFSVVFLGVFFNASPAQVCLDHLATVNSSQPTTKHHLLLRRRPQVEMSTAAAAAGDDCLYVRAEPYLCNNSEASSVAAAAPREALYTRVGAPLQRYTVSGILGGGQPLPLEQGNPLLVRHSVARLSRSSQATVDSGRYSDLRQVLSIRVENSK
jgi:hypothetical protein